MLEAYKCNTNVWREYVPRRGGTTVLCCQGTILVSGVSPKLSRGSTLGTMAGS